MSLIDKPTKYLELFDEFDLTVKEERRLATYSITNYYAVILKQAGQSYLDFPKLTNKNIGPMWNTAKSRLQMLDVDIPSQYSRLLNKLNNERNEVAHNHSLNPEKELLEEARQEADEWASWFETTVRKYDKEKGEISAKETIVRITQETLDSIKEDPESFKDPEFKTVQLQINKDVEELTQSLEELPDEENTITTKLVHIFVDSKQLEQQKQELDQTLRSIQRYTFDDLIDSAQLRTINNILEVTQLLESDEMDNLAKAADLIDEKQRQSITDMIEAANSIDPGVLQEIEETTNTLEGEQLQALSEMVESANSLELGVVDGLTDAMNSIDQENMNNLENAMESVKIEQQAMENIKEATSMLEARKRKIAQLGGWPQFSASDDSTESTE